MSEEIYQFGDMTVTLFPERLESSFDQYMLIVERVQAACERNSVPLSEEGRITVNEMHDQLTAIIAAHHDRSEPERLIFYVPMRKLQRSLKILQLLLPSSTPPSGGNENVQIGHKDSRTRD